MGDKNLSPESSNTIVAASTSKRATSTAQSNNFVRNLHSNKKETNCFVCTVDTKDSPHLEMDTTNYPMSLYSKIFNHFAKTFLIRDSKKCVVELSEERVKTVMFCKTCHGLVLQLYRLSNSSNCKAPITVKEIQRLTTLLRFKLTFGKRHNSKIRHMVRAPANPNNYHVNGYWHLRITEEKCSTEMHNSAELSAILSELDISKLTADYGIFDESHHYLTSPDWDVTPPSSAERSMDVDDDDDIGMMVDSGRIAPMDLVEVDMGDEFVNSRNENSLLMGHPFMNVPVGEIKPPRKQVLASRVGVSSKAPIIKTIIRDKRDGDEV